MNENIIILNLSFDLDLTFKCFPMNDLSSSSSKSISTPPQIWTPLELEFQTKLQWEVNKLPILLQSKSPEVRKAALKMFLLKIQSAKNTNLADLNNEAKATSNHYNTSVKLNELIVAERDSECLELLLKLMVTDHSESKFKKKCNFF